MKQNLNKDILKDIEHENADEEISLQDIEDIEAFFSTQPEIEPPKNLFNNIMEAVELKYEEENVQVETHSKENACISIKKLLFNIRHQSSLLDARFWLASFIILVLGYFILRYPQGFTFMLIAPTASVLSTYYLYRGSYYNVFEMEMACKYSLYEITLARTVIILVYNIAFVTVMAVINYTMWHVSMWTFLILTWLSPLLISYCIALYFFYKKGLIHSIIANISAWFIYAISIKVFSKINYNNGDFEKIIQMYNNLNYVIVNLILILISGIMLYNILKSMKKIYGSSDS
ncbi:hypothetical protein HBE96_03690 [Clostridium sp. P21]|uniref:ABC-2 family transporter protein n=1 Tax=Clostridium muellerianum TaxID=2716538 RepID=A0A7Y0HNN6_9CLOT|nr:hypothetical protein [Clostridium muellerianum]NMM61803.1 hypothetical protein [Clostridium muellerianum]